MADGHVVAEEVELQSEATDETVDLEIAQAMGFGSFGAKPHLQKKRKLDAQHKELTAHPSLPARPNTVEHETVMEQGLNHQSVRHPSPQEVESTTSPNNGHSASGPSAVTVRGKNQDGTWDWHALRRGVVDEDGDVAYYDQSFVEDPWAKLRSKQKE